MDPPQRDHARTVGAQQDDSDNERNDANKDGEDLSSGKGSHTSSDIDAKRASIFHYPEFITVIINIYSVFRITIGVTKSHSSMLASQ